ncbi:hypothetical protein GCG54_00015283 [Colletotrichum gloeosporioides]|uniref:Uncharacterized protein n=1 Tax=Colletotrichum gloeosporioides TaxID=474922 RepID=A0A8H4FDD7_COLGL|nr:uncharacterized protein GCG54_00015283 [Colletotrichum gloeosporioides]KAF3798302.1 hypothetical protein GCG54_00015283 [Colletotrichum gloeosporioides]
MARQADPDLMARYMKALQRRTEGDTHQDHAAETPQQPRSPACPLRPQSKEPLLHSQSQERPDLDTAVISRPQPEVPVPTYSHVAHSPPTSHGALPAATPVAVTNNYVNGDMNIHQEDQHNYQADGKRHNTTNADDATGRPGLLGRLGDFAGFLLRHWRMTISAVLLCLLSPANRKLCLNEEYRLIARNIPRVADLCAGFPSSTAVLEDAAFPPFCRTFPAIKSSHVSTSVAAIAREIVVLGDMELADVAKGDGVWKNVFTDTHRIDRNLRRTNEAYEKQRTTTYRALHRLNRRIKIEIARMEEPVSGWYAWTPDWLVVLWTGRRDQAVTLNLLDELESLAMDARAQRKAHWDDLHASGLGAGDFDAVVGDLRSFATDIAVEKKSLAVRGDADGNHDGDDEDVEKRRAAAESSEAGVCMVRQVMLDVSAAHSAFLVSLDREIHHLGELIEMTVPTLRGKARDAYGKREGMLLVLRQVQEETESWFRVMPAWECADNSDYSNHKFIMSRPFHPSLNDSLAGPDVRTRYKARLSAQNPTASGGACASGDGGSFPERMIGKSWTPVGAVVIALLAFTFWPRTPSPKPVPVPAKNEKGEMSKEIADICAIEAAVVSHVPSHEQPPTFFELLGLDPYSHPFSPPGSSTQRGAAGAAKAAAAEKLIKDAWLRLVEDVDKTYITVEIIGERGARESTESGVTQFISYKDVRSKVKLERLSADMEALRRLYNQVAQLLMDPGFRSTYIHYFMPGEQLYKSEIKKDLQQGWVHNRRAKVGEVCGWDEGDGQK